MDKSNRETGHSAHCVDTVHYHDQCSSMDGSVIGCVKKENVERQPWLTANLHLSMLFYLVEKTGNPSNDNRKFVWYSDLC